jgi:hypothetical protein
MDLKSKFKSDLRRIFYLIAFNDMVNRTNKKCKIFQHITDIFKDDIPLTMILIIYSIGV